jgi:hypothetical protein
MSGISIDDEMRQQAKIEGKRRDNYITHHFNVGHLTNAQRDEIGFLGEFSCCKMLKIDWKNNIRDNYFTIDDFDIHYQNKRIDVKTETVPFNYATSILTKTINDDLAYGRRLINDGQWNLLSKYDLVIFGLFVRDLYNTWHPIGYRETEFLIKNYQPTFDRPYGGRYPFKAAAIKTSDLKPIQDLMTS